MSVVVTTYVIDSIVFAVDFPPEAAAAAIYTTINPNADAIIIKITDIKNEKLVHDRINPNIKLVIFIGSYWEDMMDSIMKAHVVQSIVYSGKEPSYGPATFAVDNVYNSTNKPDIPKEQFLKYYHDIITDIDDRYANRNVQHTQILFAGISNMMVPTIHDSNYGRFQRLLNGWLSLSEVRSTGTTVCNMQLKLAKEQFKLRHRLCTLISGAKSVICEASILTNLTHDVAKSTYPDIQVSIVLSMFFKDEKDLLSFSIRSYDPEISAEDLAKKYGGGGDRVSAGGRIEFDSPLKF